MRLAVAILFIPAALAAQSLYLMATGMVPAGTLPDVADKTGLGGTYDFDLEYLSPAFRDRADAGGPSLFGALVNLA